MSAGWFDLYKMKEDHFLQAEVGKHSSSSDFNSKPSHVHNSASNSSIRRTLSADMMSSQNWLQTNGFPPSSLKRVKSSVQLQPALGTEDPNNHTTNNTEGPAFEDIWSSIQSNNNKSWGCILSNDGSPSDSSQGGGGSPYVHPLVKRTGSSLSEKSLEICTESLGSETGSDGFSYPPSDSEEDQEQGPIEVKHDCNVPHKLYYNNNNNSRVVGPPCKRSMMVPPTFPPPLPSLGHRDDGSNLHIRSHRQDGRLVVEAVSVPSHTCFHAKRQDGRLLLTFSEHYEHVDQFHMLDKNVQLQPRPQQDVMDDDDKAACRVVNHVQRSCTTLAMMTKFMELTNKSTTWPRNYNTTVVKSSLHTERKDEFQHEHALGLSKTTQSSLLPPRPTKSNTATATALNAYEYYWRRSSSTTVGVGVLKPLANTNNTGIQNNKKTAGKHTKRNNNSKLLYAAHSVKKVAALTPQHQHQDVSAAPAAEYVVPLMLRGCKEAKKPSLLLWEPYCIATS